MKTTHSQDNKHTYWSFWPPQSTTQDHWEMETKTNYSEEEQQEAYLLEFLATMQHCCKARSGHWDNR